MGGSGGGLRDGDRGAEDGVRAKPPLVVAAVERDERLVDLRLTGRVETDQRVADLRVDVVDRLGDALPEIARLVAVTELDRFQLAR